MIKENFNIDDILKDKLLSFEGDIPLSDWKNIENKLNRRKKRILILWFTFITILLLVGGITGFYFSNNSTLTQNSISTNTLKIEPKLNIESNKIKEVEKSNIKTESTKYVTKALPPNPIKNLEGYNIKAILNYEYLPLELKMKEIYSFGYILLLGDVELAKNINLLKYPIAKKVSKDNFSFEVGVNISPALGMEAIKENKSMNKFINHSFFSSIAKSSTFGNGMNNGINFQINYKNNLFLRTGAFISSYKVSHNYNYTISEFPNVDPKYGILNYTPALPEVVKYEGKSEMKFITLPITFGNRVFFTSKLGLESKIGFNLSKFTTAKGKSVNPTFLNLEEISNQNIRKWSKGYSLAAGLFYKSKRNFIFTIEPYYTSILGSAYNDKYPVKNRLYNYGLNFNINYILNRGVK